LDDKLVSRIGPIIMGVDGSHVTTIKNPKLGVDTYPDI
jgi:hypothetical protein